jgi:hypothetical protein
VKSAGQKTQCHVDDFSTQTANQYYNMMLTLYAVQSCINESKHLKQSFGTDDGTTAVYEQETEDAAVNDDEVNKFLSGKYEIVLSLEQLLRLWRHHHQLKCIDHLKILKKVATEKFCYIRIWLGVCTGN